MKIHFLNQQIISRLGKYLLLLFPHETNGSFLKKRTRILKIEILESEGRERIRYQIGPLGFFRTSPIELYLIGDSKVKLVSWCYFQQVLIELSKLKATNKIIYFSSLV